MAAIVCDSSSLISLSETCNIEALNFLAGKGTRFLIPPAVRNEIISTPLKIRKYQFSALRLRKVLDQKVLQIQGNRETQAKANRFLAITNSLFSVEGKPLKLVHEGEAECVGLLQQGMADALLMDEKTTRLLLEDPEKLLERMKSEYEEKIRVNQKNLQELEKMARNTTIIRSAEVLAVAAEKGFFKDFGRGEQEALHAGIYALKEAGCSLSSNEIKDYETVKV